MSKALKAAIDANDEAAVRAALKSVKDLTKKLPGATIPLCYAIEHNATNAIAPLLEIDTDYSALVEHPLQVAVMKKQTAILRQLLQHRLYNEKTLELCIRQACVRNLPDSLRALLEETKTPITPGMLRSSLNLGTDACKTLLDLGADVNARESASASAGMTALHSAVENPDFVRFLLAAGADPNAADDRGRSPLMMLAHIVGSRDFRDPGVWKQSLSLFLSAGAEPAALDRAGNNAMMYLRCELRGYRAEGGAEKIDAFRNAGLPEAGPDIDLFLAIALNEPNVDAAQAALANGADPNRLYPIGSTPLTLAAYKPLPFTQLLLDAGADSNRFAAKTAPLLEAAASGALDVVQLLLDQGADLHALEKSASPRNAYTAALMNNKPETAAYLKSRGAVRPQPADFKPIIAGVNFDNDFEELLIKTDPASAAAALASLIQGKIIPATYGSDITPGKHSFVIARPKNLAWSNLFQITPPPPRWSDAAKIVAFAKPLAKATNTPVLFIQYSDTSDAAEIHRIEPDGSATRQDSYDQSTLEEIVENLGDQAPAWAIERLAQLRKNPKDDTDILPSLAASENFAAAFFNIDGKAGAPLELAFENYPAEAFDAVTFVST